jgi:pimeloyl-ACP methyl ester carboxylesterase
MKHPQFYRQVAVSMATHDAGDDARRVTCPVRMLQGDSDEVFTQKQVARIRELMPQTEFEVVEGGTHSMVYTRGDEVAGRIRDFCMRHCEDTLGAGT